jgi:hypothetical protein
MLLAACGSTPTAANAPTPRASSTPAAAARSTPTPKPKQQSQPQVVTFTVTGSAPDGVDIQYGSDSSNNSPSGVALPWTITMPYDSNAEYYSVSAQLQGDGTLQCSVTVHGKTKNASANGAYQICDAQLSNLGFGWS